MPGIADLTAGGWLARVLGGAIVRLNSSGVIDPSLIPPTGEQTMLIDLSAPGSGTTVQVADSTLTQIIKPAGGLAALTIKLPKNPGDRQPCEIVFKQAIVLLTIGSDTGTVDGFPSTIALGGYLKYRYRLADNTWYRVG